MSLWEGSNPLFESLIASCRTDKVTTGPENTLVECIVYSPLGGMWRRSVDRLWAASMIAAARPGQAIGF